MIYLEYRISYLEREPTEGGRQGTIRYCTALTERGENIKPELLRGDFTLGGRTCLVVGVGFDGAHR